MPKCFIYINSPLDIKLRINDSHPTCTAWTMYETSIGNKQLDYTFSSFTPDDEESILNAVDFINKYIVKYHGVKIITDFDGQVPRLSSKVNLMIDPLNTGNGIGELSRINRIISRWLYNIKLGCY